MLQWAYRRLAFVAICVATFSGGPGFCQGEQLPAGLNTRALEYMEAGNYDKAASYVSQALDLDTKANDTGAVCRDLSNQGLIYLRQGKYADAEIAYKNALARAKEMDGADSASAATGMNNLAMLYYNMGDLAEAESLLKKALEVRKHTYGSNDPRYAWNAMNLACVYSAEGKSQNGIELLEKAVAIEEGARDTDPDAIVTAWWQLAQAYEGAANWERAETYYKKILGHDEASEPKDAHALLSDFEALQAVLKAQGKSVEAGACKVRADRLRQLIPNGKSMVRRKNFMDVPQSQLCPIADKWALVIGISNFKDPSINLRYAAKDATDFRNYLVSEANFKPDHVKLLTDENATHDNIAAYLGDKWLRSVAKRDDLVVIYVSSHGCIKKELGTSLIVPYEGNLSNIVFTGIPMQWLTVGVHDVVACDRILLLMDVCHGGSVDFKPSTAPANEEVNSILSKSIDSLRADGAEKTKPAGQFTDSTRQVKGDGTTSANGIFRMGSVEPENVDPASNQLILASSQSEQLSWESKTYPNGVFTRRLIEGLRLKKGATTIGEAYDYVVDRVEEEVLRDRAELQTPIMLTRLWHGDDLVLQVKPANPRSGLLTASVQQSAETNQTHPTSIEKVTLGNRDNNLLRGK